MILGIGIDTIEISRVLRACDRSKRFVEKTFTPLEIEQSTEHKVRIASDFAGKEAVVKAFRTGFYRCVPREIEILRGELDEPYIRLYGKAEKVAKQMGICQMHISITNTKDEVTAFVVATDEEGAALQPLYGE
ncbi:MAG: holo-ACP synthase [Eubacterium sp.]